MHENLVNSAAGTGLDRLPGSCPSAGAYARDGRRLGYRALLAAVATAALAAAIPNAHAAPVFMGLGPPPEGYVGSRAYGAFDNGRLITTALLRADGTKNAALWRAETGFVRLPVLSDADDSTALHASADGTRVFGEAGAYGAIWTAGPNGWSRTDLPGTTAAITVTPDGRIVAGYDRNRLHSTLWVDGELTRDLGDFPGGIHFNEASDMTPDGAVIVGRSNGAFSQAYRWTEDTGLQGLGDLPGGGALSHAWGVSDDGSVIVGDSTSAAGSEAFRWTEETGMQPLGDLPGGIFDSRALEISGDGSIIVGDAHTAAGRTAFLWTAEEGMRSLQDILTVDYDLDLTGWHLQYARRISADGRVVVGQAINPDGALEAYMVTFDANAVPEPHSLALLGAGLVALGAGLGRQRAAG